MKDFKTYQYLKGEPMTNMDKAEKDSKFWNEGKWKNFIEPLLPADCQDMTFVDVGCNAGLFLKLAKEKGFDRAIGVEADKDAYNRGIIYRDNNKFDYKIINDKIENCDLPLADFTILSNVHYYIGILDWLEYVDKLESKTRYCLIITKKANDRHYRPLTSIADTKYYFRNWEQVGAVYDVDKNDPAPREIYSLLFKSRKLDRTPIKLLKNVSMDYQKEFYDEIEKGTNFLNTKYLTYWKKWRKDELTDEEIKDFVKGKVNLFEDIKQNGMQKPIVIGQDNSLLDGNHRLEINRRLGYKSIISRKT
jgi:SAM-dependent methyltransferase